MIKAVIVEDSGLARAELKELLKNHPHIKIVGEAADADSAVELILLASPQLVFMDIDLPGGDAFDVLSRLEWVPPLIFTTAFSEFALTAFDYNTVDYLLKPIRAKRLQQALEKLALSKDASNAESDQLNSLAADGLFFVKDGDACFLVKVSDVRYLESIGNYTRIHFLQHAPMHYSALSRIEQRLQGLSFFRASRQHLVNLKFIQKIEPWVTGGFMLTLSCGTEVEVSRRQAGKFKQMMSL